MLSRWRAVLFARWHGQLVVRAPQALENLPQRLIAPLRRAAKAKFLGAFRAWTTSCPCHPVRCVCPASGLFTVSSAGIFLRLIPCGGCLRRAALVTLQTGLPASFHDPERTSWQSSAIKLSQTGAISAIFASRTASGDLGTRLVGLRRNSGCQREQSFSSVRPGNTPGPIRPSELCDSNG